MKWSPLGKEWMQAGILLIIALIIKIVSFFNLWIENNYSTHLYKYIAAFFRLIFGWLPFSIGDVFYTLIILWLFIKTIKAVITIFKKKLFLNRFLFYLVKAIQFVLSVYIFFNLLWGLNYNRSGIAYQLKLQPSVYSTTALQTLTDSLITKVNMARLNILKDTGVQHIPYKKIFEKAKNAYKNNAVKNFPFLNYNNTSIKPSLFGRLDNYLGFLGYYNPFTGEAQVNVTVPVFIIPYVTCHEVAHQLGYGSESEANFVGYLAAKASNDKLLHYSMYFELFIYANSELFDRDSISALQNYKLLDTFVRKDLITYKKFLLAHKNPFEPFVTAFYSQYLKANNQPKGIDTYNEVIAWLIAYQKKYGVL
jgi:hypothetical protein